MTEAGVKATQAPLTLVYLRAPPEKNRPLDSQNFSAWTKVTEFQDEMS